MVVRSLLSAIALTALAMTARAAEPAAPAVHALHEAPSVHGSGKGGAIPRAGATVPGIAVAPKAIGTVGSRIRPHTHEGVGDKALGNLPSSGGVTRGSLVKPLGTLGSGVVGHGTASGSILTRSAAQINGTGMVRRGVGPSSIGASARPRNGINGTGIKGSGIGIR
jgi:hypothetical protein